MEQEMSSLQTDLSQVKNEKSDLLSMNENLSNQVSDHLNTIKKLQDKEQDLLLKLDNSKRDLELAHNGMTAGKKLVTDRVIPKTRVLGHFAKIIILFFNLMKKPIIIFNCDCGSFFRKIKNYRKSCEVLKWDFKAS